MGRGSFCRDALRRVRTVGAMVPGLLSLGDGGPIARSNDFRLFISPSDDRDGRPYPNLFLHAHLNLNLNFNYRLIPRLCMMPLTDISAAKCFGRR